MSSAALAAPALPRDLPKKIATHAAALLLLAVCVDAVSDLRHADPVVSQVVPSTVGGSPAGARLPDAHDGVAASRDERPAVAVFEPTAPTLDTKSAAMSPVAAAPAATTPGSTESDGVRSDGGNTDLPASGHRPSGGTPEPAPPGDGKGVASVAGGTAGDGRKQAPTRSTPVPVPPVEHRAAPAEPPPPQVTPRKELPTVPAQPTVARPVPATPPQTGMPQDTQPPPVVPLNGPVPARPIGTNMTVLPPATMAPRIAARDDMNVSGPAVAVGWPTKGMRFGGPRQMVGNDTETMD
ncbi:hypothetical protein AB0A74_00680 [Saccharothrix sp. NPDC042600]|uniref:hypothetical protein n=1 Tax=Saccharothrix TaxID=2071 RepID=UPI0033E2C249|nr:hypothetical protein GCM10017745_48260 [Saccharothrix mutabilis subsp. capreolus]